MVPVEVLVHQSARTRVLWVPMVLHLRTFNVNVILYEMDEVLYLESSSQVGQDRGTVERCA